MSLANYYLKLRGRHFYLPLINNYPTVGPILLVAYSPGTAVLDMMALNCQQPEDSLGAVAQVLNLYSFVFFALELL